MTMLRLFFVSASVLAPVLAISCLKLYAISEDDAYRIRGELEERRGEV